MLNDNNPKTKNALPTKAPGEKVKHFPANTEDAKAAGDLIEQLIKKHPRNNLKVRVGEVEVDSITPPPFSFFSKIFELLFDYFRKIIPLR